MDIFISTAPQLETFEDGEHITGFGALYYNPTDPGSEYEVAKLANSRRVIRFASGSLDPAEEVFSYWEHDNKRILGRTGSGTFKIRRHPNGWKYALRLDMSDPDHVSLAAKVRRGDIRGASVGIRNPQWAYRKEGKNEVQELTKAEIHEISFTHNPAFKGTTASFSVERYDENWFETQKRLTELQGIALQ